MSSVKRKRVAAQRKARGMMLIGKKWKRPNFFIAAWNGDQPPSPDDWVPVGYARSMKINWEDGAE